eukprot:scaffold14436_cov142-Isochrysis_galbana.AAC.1
MPRTSIPGFYCEHAWSIPAQKRRHFVVEGQHLKLFGRCAARRRPPRLRPPSRPGPLPRRRGKTFKSQINLTA